MNETKGLVTVMLASTSIVLLVILALVGYVGYVMVDLSYDIASNASGSATKAPYVSLAKITDDKKCFQISNDFTIPDDGVLYAKLGEKVEKAQFRSRYWKTCFDKEIDGDFFVRGTFAGEDIVFGPYKNVWGQGRVSLAEWTITDTNEGYVGIISNNIKGTTPANMGDIDEEKAYSLVSITGMKDSRLEVYNRFARTSNLYVLDPFGTELPKKLNLNNEGNIMLDLTNWDQIMLISESVK